MLSHEDNELLCRVQGDAPMGQVMRRSWLPVCMSSEVPDWTAAPLGSRIVGERLVVYRDATGRVGVIQERCPHRGASLCLGRSEGDGIRCIYHGWKITIDGEVIETPSEPESSRVRNAVHQPSYPTHEAGGMVWVYLGPPETIPDPPSYRWMHLPDSHIQVRKVVSRANWAQSLEGGIDSAHSDFLHRSETVVSTSGGLDEVGAGGRRSRPSADTAPRLEVHDTAFGFVYAALRKAAIDPDNLDYVKVTAFIAPVSCMIAPYFWHASVPVDDEWTAFYLTWWKDDSPLSESEVADMETFLGLRYGEHIQFDHHRPGNAANLWLQDRAAMNDGSNYTGIRGTTVQDTAIQESMGPIQDRTIEHLGRSDRAISHFRTIMLAAAREVVAGGEPRLVTTPFDYARAHGGSGVVKRGADWIAELDLG